MSEHLKLVVHHGERARVPRRLAGDVLLDLVGEAGVAAAVALRGVEGFGAHHRLRTDRLLTLSDDLPLATVAVGPAGTVAPLATAAAEVVPSGLLTLERVTLPGPRLDDVPAASSGTSKLTVHCPRSRLRAVAAALHDERILGVTALVGVDGVLGGRRRRARATGAGGDVPGLVIGVGPAGTIARALPRVRAAAGPHVACLERVNVVRRAGAAVGPLPVVPERDPGGLGLWQRMIVALGAEGGAAQRLVRDLRAAGGAGATALRGAWAALGEGPAHAERLLALRRRAPFHLTIVETPAGLARVWPIVEAATAREGLVTCELLPAVRTHRVGGRRIGGLRLAAPG